MRACIPFFAKSSILDKEAVFSHCRVWTWRDIHESSLFLAKRLSGKSIIINMCESYVGFLVTWLAIARCGALQILPNSNKTTDIDHALLNKNNKKSIVVIDEMTDSIDWAIPSQTLLFKPDEKSVEELNTMVEMPDRWVNARVCLYTSGSTGKPQPELKTMSQLMVGASVLGVRLSQIMGSPINQVDAIVSSVSPRHMYGIEAVLMLSLVHGIAVFDQRPLLPADIFHAFQSVRGKALWVTTPLHMRALVRDGSSITSCRGVISSTMPLDKAIAHGIQNASQAQVIEIYGSTETGAIATRVASDIDSWLLLPEVRMRSDSSGVRVLSSHNEQPKKLQDIVQMLSPTSFRLMGRHNDVIKVAGKRASLAGLNQIIQSVSGLEESVLYMPSAGVEDQRPVLIFVGEPLDYRSLKKRLEKKMVSAFIPRTLIRVEKLPVSLSGKIPLSELEKIYKNADMEK